MMTEIQKIILACLLGPEDPRAFFNEKARLRAAEIFDTPEGYKKITERNRKARSTSEGREKSREANRKIHSTSEGREKKQESDRRSYHKTYATPEGRKKRLERARKNSLNQRRRDPAYRIKCALRSRFQGILSEGEIKKNAHTFDLLGCPQAWLEAHLESLFKPGMTFGNYGRVWHIDHKRPCSSFDLTDPEQQKACFHWTNLQPLFAADNLSKGAKWTTQ